MGKKILIIKSSSMGDVVHALPVAYDIHQHLPDATIDWVVEESFQDIPRLSPCVSGVVVTAFRRWRKNLFSRRTWEEIRAVKKQLRQARYDCVIDLQGLMRSALVARWTHARTIGYSRDTIREPMASFLYEQTQCVPESLRPVRRYRTMAGVCLGYDTDETKPVYGLRATEAIPVKLPAAYVAMAVNTSRDEKLWPEQNWIEIASHLREKGLTSVFFWGSQKERLRVEAIAGAVPDSVVLPKLNLLQCAAVLKKSVGMIGVDTGLAHLGAALAVPSVGIIVGTPAELFSLVGEGPCITVGDKGQVPTVSEVEKAYQGVTQCG